MGIPWEKEQPIGRLRCLGAFELVPGRSPIGDAPRVPPDAGVPSLDQSTVCELAGEAGRVAAVHDDLIVEIKALSCLFHRVEVQ